MYIHKHSSSKYPKMLNKVVKVETGEKTFHLVGTAHVSPESVELVENTIDDVEPDVVAVELCEQRHEAILNQSRWDEKEIDKVIREGKAHLFLMQLMLTNFQRKIGEELDTKPGSEMIEAVEKAQEKGIEVALVDRDIRTSLKRAFNELSWKEKIGLAYGFLEGFLEEGEEDVQDLLEEMQDTDVLTEMIEELGREAPSFKKVLLDERNEYIAYKLMEIEQNNIVAVLGAGHLKGVKEILEKNEEKNKKQKIDELEQIPEGKSTLKYIGYAVPAVILALVVTGFFLKGQAFVLESLLKWIFINGTLSAIGATLAFGHPLSIITAFLSAPLTSMNPLLASGWFAGLMEARIRKPRVKDFEGLMKLDSLRDYWRNGVTRILLVMALANMGSVVGTYLAGFSIFAGIYSEILELVRNLF